MNWYQVYLRRLEQDSQINLHCKFSWNSRPYMSKFVQTISFVLLILCTLVVFAAAWWLILIRGRSLNCYFSFLMEMLIFKVGMQDILLKSEPFKFIVQKTGWMPECDWHIHMTTNNDMITVENQKLALAVGGTYSRTVSITRRIGGLCPSIMHRPFLESGLTT